MREDAKEAVRRALPIEAVVAETVALRKVGDRLVGLCPFHAERTPSFTVTPERGLFYCFGCHAGGDVFDFVMRRDGLSFPEALRVLAERAGVRLEEASDPQDRRREQLLALLERACAWFEERLWSEEGRAAQAYLARRGVSREAAARFRLGLAPASGPGVLQRLAADGFPPESAVQAGLAVRRGGTVRELLRGRLVFPIRDRAGRVVAFAGRALLPEQRPKYLNSPDTPFFRKRSVLYDWGLARAALRAHGQAVLVEGYMDVIALHEAGVAEALAPMGTALGEEQVDLLAKAVPRVVIAYDGDTAGQEATRRSLWLLARAGVEVLVAELPKGMDPDEVARAEGEEGLRRRLAAALPLTQYLVRRALPAGREASPKEKAAVAREVLRGIFLLRDPVEQEAEVQRLVAVLQVDEGAVRRLIASMRRSRRAGGTGLEEAAARNTSRQTTLRREIEVAIITLLAREPSLAADVTEPFADPDAALLLAALQRGEDPSRVERESARRLWAEALARPAANEVSLEQWLAHLRREGQRLRLDELRKEITSLERSGQPVPEEWMAEMIFLLRETKGPLEGGTTP